MGQKSQAKREKKAVAKKAAQWGDVAPSTHYVGRLDDHPVTGTASSSRAVSQMFRRTCPECSSPDLAWMTPAELAEQVDDEQKGNVADGLKFLAGASDAWLCRKCGNFGLM